MKHRTAILFIGAALLLVIVWICYHLLSKGSTQTTDDAYIRADTVMVSSRVSGQISRVLVEDNQRVKAGQLLVEIDDRDYRAAQAAAQAQVNATRAVLKNLAAKIERQQAVIDQATATTAATAASLKFAHSNARRYLNLSQVGAGTQEERQKSEAELQKWQALSSRDEASRVAALRERDVLKAEYETQSATLEENKAALLQANLNLSYTRITAPYDGTVGKRTVRVGAWATTGHPMLAVVPLEQAYVVANYRETQIAHMVENQPVTLKVDGIPDRVFSGHISSIAPATGMSFSAIVPDNATGNFTKVVQRVPVKIFFDKHQPLLNKLRVGMSVIVTTDTSHRSAHDGLKPARADKSASMALAVKE